MGHRRTNSANVGTKHAPREADRTAAESSDQAQGYKPPGADHGLGFARKRDIEDRNSQAAAPIGPGKYDRTGEDDYAEGLEEFEEDGGGTAANAADAEQKAKWELDEGGVEFGPTGRRAPEADAERAAGVSHPRSSAKRSR